MSADNWAVCPRCVKQDEARLVEMTKNLDSAYGKVPLEEFDRLRAERDEFAEGEADYTFREDYEFYLDEDGVLHVSYSGKCTECGLSHNFKHTETIDLEQAAK